MFIRRLFSLRSVGLLKGFITVPGLISLSGVVAAVAIAYLDRMVSGSLNELLPAYFRGAFFASPENVRPVLSAIAGSAMTALSLVYSSVLVVFTLAAGNIGPRLLMRFAEDRINQVAVGTLGATYLYCIVILRLQQPEHLGGLAVDVAVFSAAASVVMLLFFVNSAARKVTVDEEIAQIGDTLEKEIARILGTESGYARDDLVRPQGAAIRVGAAGHGYINQISVDEVVRLAAGRQAFVDFTVSPGSYLVEGQEIATIIGHSSEPLFDAVQRALVLGRSRTTTDDIDFSIDLLVEIALRALSPGVNDTFTAVACTDRLSSALATVRREHLATGVYCDSEGAARVTIPTITMPEMIERAFAPLRRAATGNLLMHEHLISALGRLGLGEDLPGEDAIRNQLELMRERLQREDLLEADRQRILDLLDRMLERQVGKPLANLSHPSS